MQSPQLKEAWDYIDEIVEQTTHRVAAAFRAGRLGSTDLMGSTGYGYQDRGREQLDRITAEIFGAPAALIRPQWASGTHALATALKAAAQRTPRVWMASGTPYDTILPTLRELSRHGLAVEVCEPGAEGPRIEAMHPQRGDVVYVQRSRGYSGRRSWGKAEISLLVEWAHAHGAQVIVDNCYGEFTHHEEPGHWGADLVVGSLMKNPGGAVAPTGAYAAGTQVWIDAVADALFAPGIGAEVGATGPYLRLFAQGLFLAPLLVGEALKGGLYISERAQRAGFQVDPAPDDWDRNDIVVAVELGSAERVVRFCQTIQSFEPVDGFVTPEPWDMPGYDHPVIMAAGGFVAGGSLELSCDAPIRPPYHVYIQGGINRWHTMAAVDAAFGTLA